MDTGWTDPSKGFTKDDVEKNPQLRGCLYLADYLMSLMEQKRLSQNGGEDDGALVKCIEEDLKFIETDMDKKGLV